MSPIGINENFVDITARATSKGRPARISYRPRTAAFHVRSTVKTAARGSAPSWQATQTGPREITVSGTVPVGSGPLLQVFFIPNPAAFARTAFIEALRRAGVSVAASSVGAEPAQPAAAQPHLPGEPPRGVAAIGSAVADREGDPQGQRQPRRRPAGVPGGRQARQAQLLRGSAVPPEQRRVAGFARERHLRLRRWRLRRPRSHQPDRADHVPASRPAAAVRVGLPRGAAASGGERDASPVGQGTSAAGNIEAKPGNIAFATPALGIAGASNLSATSRPGADARSCSPTSSTTSH
jgi:D-Ala-D-Ala carboxypeptidase 3 (S13) family protein